MSTTPLFNPFPNAPGVTDLGDGRRLVETHDRGHAIRMVEPDGAVSMVICMNSPSPLPKPVSNGKYHVRHARDGHEVIDPEGNVYARTTDAVKADHIRKLLTAYEMMKAKKASSGV